MCSPYARVHEAKPPALPQLQLQLTCVKSLNTAVCPSHATITVPQLRSERPPVLAAAEGDEHLGENAGQFADLDASGRQALIDKKSPAQSSTN